MTKGYLLSKAIASSKELTKLTAERRLLSLYKVTPALACQVRKVPDNRQLHPVIGKLLKYITGYTGAKLVELRAEGIRINYDCGGSGKTDITKDV